MRPLLMMLGDYRSLTLNVVNRLTSVTRLFPNSFNDKFCDQMMVRARSTHSPESIRTPPTAINMVLPPEPGLSDQPEPAAGPAGRGGSGGSGSSLKDQLRLNQLCVEMKHFVFVTEKM